MDATGTSSRPYRFAVSATFNAEPLAPFFRFWGEELNTSVEIEFAPFNQPLQTLLAPDSVFARNQDGLNVLLFRAEDIGPLGNADQLLENTSHLAGAIRTAASHLAVPLLVVSCPSSAPVLPDAYDRRLEQQLGEAPGVCHMAWRDLLRLYPVDDYLNPLGEKLGGIPYTDTFFAALGTAIFRHAHALTNRPYKVIALDCDNTLWQGICGEDGPSGVTLDPGRRMLQQFMLEQRDAGMLLAIVSKNNRSDVEETFARNPDFPLSLRHFAATRINWENKAGNLAALAEELNLGTDAIIFLDDNPLECAEVEETLPEVLSLNLPADGAAIEKFLRHIWAFDHPVITEEDRQRSTMYQQVQEFGKALRGAESLEHFLATLQLEVKIRPLEPERAARTAQLTQRTNQFNTTTIRRNETEIRALAQRPGWTVWTVDAADRFGDYGQVGAMILKEQPGNLEVETFLLSCRALGRGVEHHMMRHAGARANALGIDTVLVPFAETARNAPARLFLDGLGKAEPLDGALRYRFRSEALANVAMTAAPVAAAPARKSKGRGDRRRFVEYSRLARELSTPAAVLQRVRQRNSSHTPLSGTETEMQLGAIWRELLETPPASAGDNFFDLGGHSLQAVLLLLRIREQFGVELGIDDVYSGTATLGSMAALIDARKLEAANPEEYAALLAQIEQMSDEEVQALLAEQERLASGDS